jgi:hypothetical protein
LNIISKEGITDMDTTNKCNVCNGRKVIVSACDGTGSNPREPISADQRQPPRMSCKTLQFGKKRGGPKLWGPAYYQGRKFDSPSELANSMKPPIKIEGRRDMKKVFEDARMIDGTPYPRKFTVVIGAKDPEHPRGKFQVFDR